VDEHSVLIFLLSLALLLGVARLLGELARMLGLPMVVGEILAGIVLGRTGLGRFHRELHDFVFPSAGPPVQMLAGYTTTGVVLLLVVAGLEVDLRIVKRRGRSALLIAALGVVIPLLGGFLLGHAIPAHMLVRPEQRDLFALFMGVALSISALPVIAKTLLDLGLFRTDIGLLVMTAAMIDDIIGWLAFSILLGPVRGGQLELVPLAKTIILAVVFVALCLVVGRKVVDKMLERIEREAHAAPGRILSIVTVLALLGATATQAIGLHAVFGGFVVGVMMGDSRRLRERTRHTIQQFVTNVFAPVFFASVALRVDFFSNFDAALCAGVFFVASLAKLLGCTLGARLSGIGYREALAVGFGLNARGAMEIILAILARQAGLIDDRVFVALVTMAMATSLLAGPMMKHLLGVTLAGQRGGGGKDDDAASLVRAGAFVPELGAATAARAIDELGRALHPVLGDLVEPAIIATLERELVASTGLGDSVAIPHASVAGLTHPVVALGLSKAGIDFDAPDGAPARIVFLLLLPPRAFDKEVRVLASLSRSVFDAAAREALLEATNPEEAVQCLAAESKRIREGHPAHRPLAP
jgi:Kef-type K+ transport system membrane component KefB/mannitol/fructose-specific phosphotransferase system IIA component (Ntr-type)